MKNKFLNYGLVLLSIFTLIVGCAFLNINILNVEAEQIEDTKIYVGTNDGVEDGSQIAPYNTVGEALNIAQDGDVIVLLNSVASLPTTSKSITFEGATNDIHITNSGDNYLGGGSGSASVIYKNIICDNARAIAPWGVSQVNVSYVFENVSFSTLDGGTCVFLSDSTVKSITIRNCKFNDVNNTSVWFMNTVGEFKIENSIVDNAEGFLKVRYADTSIIRVNNNTFKNCDDIVLIEGNATTETQIYLTDNSIQDCTNLITIKESTGSQLYVNNNKINNCENVLNLQDCEMTADDILKTFEGNTYNGLKYTDIDNYPVPDSNNSTPKKYLYIILAVSLIVCGLVIVIVSSIIIYKKRKSNKH